MSRASRAVLLVLSVAAAILAAAFFLPREPCLTLRAGDGRVVAAYTLDRDEPRFQIAYRHSVALLPAVEYFRPGPGGAIELYRTAYKGLGAGLPFTDEGGVARLQDGWIVIEGLKRDFRSVTLSPMPLTRHSLRIGGREVDLARLAAGSALELRLERKPLAGRLVFGRRMGYIKP